MEIVPFLQYAVGSNFTCSDIPGFVPKDHDSLVYIPENELENHKQIYLNFGYVIDGKYGELKGKFISLRKGNHNVILSNNYLWCFQFLRANALCKKLQLADKEKRIAVHEAFLSMVM